MPIATPLTTWRAENVSWYKRRDGYKRHLKADYKRSYSFLFLMQVIMASNTCHGKLWLLKVGNPRRTLPLRSVFSTFPTDRKFEFKLEIKANRRYYLVLVCSCSHDFFYQRYLLLKSILNCGIIIRRRRHIL